MIGFAANPGTDVLPTCCRRAADVVDCNCQVTERVSHVSADPFEFRRPCRVVVGDDDWAGQRRASVSLANSRLDRLQVFQYFGSVGDHPLWEHFRVTNGAAFIDDEH